ncbi:hypothetical protein PMAYCL1PPCAC_31554, partial [Pristionchus mayeri]
EYSLSRFSDRLLRRCIDELLEGSITNYELKSGLARELDVMHVSEEIAVVDSLFLALNQVEHGHIRHFAPHRIA